MDLCGFVWCGSGPVLCCFAIFLLAKRKSGREICGSSLLPFFVCSLFFCVSMMCLGCEAKEFHIFCTLFYRFSHCQDRALERDRPQQRKKMLLALSLFCGALSPLLCSSCPPSVWLVVFWCSPAVAPSLPLSPPRSMVVNAL